MLQRARLRELAVGALLALGGCAGAGNGIGDLPPEVSLADIRFGEAGLLEQQLLLSLRISNPNDTPLRVDYLRYRLELNGTEVGEATDGSDFTIDANGMASRQVALYAQTGVLLERALDIASRRGVGYRLEGELGSDSLGAGRAAIAQAGQIDLSTLAGTR